VVRDGAGPTCTFETGRGVDAQALVAPCAVTIALGAIVCGYLTGTVVWRLGEVLGKV
jgi:hypothetical protein